MSADFCGSNGWSFFYGGESAGRESGFARSKALTSKRKPASANQPQSVCKSAANRLQTGKVKRRQNVSKAAKKMPRRRIGRQSNIVKTAARLRHNLRPAFEAQPPLRSPAACRNKRRRHAGVGEAPMKYRRGTCRARGETASASQAALVSETASVPNYSSAVSGLPSPIAVPPTTVTFLVIASRIAEATSGFCMRYCFAASRPCPMSSPL